MLTLKKLTEETLTKANVLTYQQMSKVVGGSCYIRCDQTIDVEAYPEAIQPIGDCSRDSAERSCPGGIDKAICGC